MTGYTETCSDETATEAAGQRLALRLQPGDLISLEGDLGAGKTVFTRGLARGLGLPAQAISSPSYVLAIEHPQATPPLLHVDLYRLGEAASIDGLGIEEALDDGFVVVVEWGQRLPPELRKIAWVVTLEAFVDERRIEVQPPARAGYSRR